ncbi:EAL domain-containing protein [Actinotalea solisilvae]|uniref:EAL domain-containing protein n=1 Tax=Actinotalea solisilvae TaxID=2072922 RepID=UPI0018F11EBB|nr:EAL domain-containing protein [Actinotalea solisilvae]
MGHRVLDDFGTGYSSLAYLRRLPVDRLKVDRPFTRGVAGSSEDLAVVSSVVQLARALGLRTVAEGVETAEQRDVLTVMGCETAQGYLWSPALPMADLAAWSAARAG